jgi:hypothetical protein
LVLPVEPLKDTLILENLLSDLSYSSILAEDVVKFLRSDLERKIAHEYYPVHFRWQTHLRKRVIRVGSTLGLLTLFLTLVFIEIIIII